MLKTNIKNIEWAKKELENGLRKFLPNFSTVDMAVIALLLYKARNMGKDSCGETIKELPEDIQNDIHYYSKAEVTWNDVKFLLNKYDADVFLDILKSIDESDSRRNTIDSLPESLTMLAKKIMDVKDNTSGLQLYSGCGKTMNELVDGYSGVAITGVENTKQHNLIARLKATAFNNNKFIVCDSIKYCLENRDKEHYDFVLSTHPLGLKLRKLNDNLNELTNIYPVLKNGTAVDWVCCLLAMDVLNIGGKAVAFMSSGCMFTNQDKDVRKFLIHNGYIEAVVELPNKMYPQTGINTIMVVLSKGNREIKLVDATNIYTPGRRQNEFTEENIDEILNAYNNITDKSVVVNVEELEKKDYNLLPTRFITEQEQEVENGQFLEDLVTFNRSAVITASELDKLAVSENTESENYYLRLSEIHDGVIEKHLPKLRNIDEKYEKHLLKNNDIILSRNGTPFKVALYTEKGNRRVLPVGNLLILRAKVEKVNPMYLKAYLESENGVASLGKIMTGVAMQVISLERLKKMVVPVPDMDEQNKIAEKYLSVIGEIEELNSKLITAKERLLSILK